MDVKKEIESKSINTTKSILKECKTMNTTININDYLTEDEMKEIAKQEFSSLFCSKEEKERILYNFAHHSAGQFIEDTLTKEDLITLKNNVKKTIRGKNLEYHVFKKPDAWDKKLEYSDYIVYREIQKVIAENIDLIREKVVEALKNAEIKRHYEESFDPVFLLELMIKGLSK